MLHRIQLHANNRPWIIQPCRFPRDPFWSSLHSNDPACLQTWGWNPFLFSNSHGHLWHSNSICPDMACDRGLSAGWSVSTSSLLVWHFVIISTCQSWASQHQEGFVRPLVAVHSDVTGRWPNLGMNISHIDRFWSRPWWQWWIIWPWWISADAPSEETDKERQGGFRLRSPCRKVFQQFVRFLDLQQRGCKEIT